MSKLFARLIPFILFGVAVVTFFLGLLLLTYIFVFGALVGLALFGIAWIKERFFPTKQMTKRHRNGEIIDHDKY